MEPCTQRTDDWLPETGLFPEWPYLFHQPSMVLGILPTPSVTPTAIPNDSPSHLSRFTQRPNTQLSDTMPTPKLNDMDCVQTNEQHHDFSTLLTDSVSRVPFLLDEVPSLHHQQMDSICRPSIVMSPSNLDKWMENSHSFAQTTSLSFPSQDHLSRENSSRLHQPNRSRKHASNETSDISHHQLSIAIASEYSASLKQRRRLSRDETEYLLERFQEQERPSANDRAKYAKHLKLDGRTIQIWFQNRRAKMRKDELIARDLHIGIQNDVDDDNDNRQARVGDQVETVVDAAQEQFGTGTETFVGFVGSPTSEQLCFDIGLLSQADSSDYSGEPYINKGEGITPLSLGDCLYLPSQQDIELSRHNGLYGYHDDLLNEINIETSFDSEARNMGNDGLNTLSTISFSDVQQKTHSTEEDCVKGLKAQMEKEAPDHTNYQVPRHQRVMRLVPREQRSIYALDAASSWERCFSNM